VNSCCQQPPAGHGRRPPHAGRGPNRNVAARAAIPIASTASANTDPAGSIGPCNGSRRYAHTVKCDRMAAAFAPNRRNHPRTVPAGTPRRRAIRTHPVPPPWPSTRRRSPNYDHDASPDTNPAKEPAYDHTTGTDHAEDRTPRCGPRPATPGPAHTPTAQHPRHTGQATRPPVKSDSTRPTSFRTMSTMPPASTEGPPRTPPRDQRGGPDANRTSPR